MQAMGTPWALVATNVSSWIVLKPRTHVRGYIMDASPDLDSPDVFPEGTMRRHERPSTMNLETTNNFIRRNLPALEMTGVLMRIFSFSLVSWLGPDSPFLFVWIFNTADAVMLSWCSALKKDRAYTLLNTFWIFVGLVGIYRASAVFH